MKKIIILIAIFSSQSLCAQKIDSIAFHLYTDSLKKEVHNYINVDGKTSNGNWFPLSAKEISFTSSAGVFEGCNLIIPNNYTGNHIVIHASLKANPALFIKTIIWIKQKPDPEKLPTLEELNKKVKKDTTRNKTKSANNKKAP